MSKLNSYVSLLQLSHAILSLPFAIMGYFLAIYFNESVVDFDLSLIILLGLCLLTARAAGLGFNRYLDRDIDKDNPRTAKRLIPIGRLKPKEVLIFSLINGALFILFAGLINSKCLMFAPAVLALLYFYSYTKRFTAACHLVLGIIFGSVPLAVWIAATNTVSYIPMYFGFGIMLWVTGFDILYATQDEAFDKMYGLKSIPVKIGKTDSVSLVTVLYLLALAVLVRTGFKFDLGIYYWMGLLAFADLLLAQIVLVLSGDKYIKVAFLYLNSIGAILFATGCIIDLIF